MWTPDYFVRMIDLPRTVNGVTLPNDDGSFDVFINSALPEEEQKEALEHEIEHIRQDHFYNDIKSVAQIEAEAEKAPQPEPQRKMIVFNSLEALKKAFEWHLQREF